MIATGTALERRVFEIIEQNPGINRKGIYKCLGNNTPASSLVKSLGSLKKRRLVRARKANTGGRPAECWWPVLTPEPTSVVPQFREKKTRGCDVRLAVSCATNGYIAQVDGKIPHLFPDTKSLMKWFEREMNARFDR